MERNVLWRVLGVVCLLGVLCAPGWGRYDGGSGTAFDPYRIRTADHLREVYTSSSEWRRDVCYRLMADIDLEKAPMWPIGTAGVHFVGVFDGDGHTISNLNVRQTSGENVGLFGYADAEFRDLTLADVEINGGQCTAVGALVGTLGMGRVERCAVISGTVSGGEQVGGLVGKAGGVIHQCHASCSVSGQDMVGGLVGVHSGYGVVSQCRSTSSVSGDGRVGGLIGHNYAILRDCYATGEVQGRLSVGGLAGMGGVICNCYAAGRVQGTWYVGGLAGGQTVVCSSFWDTLVSGPTSSSNGVGKTTAELRRAATFRGWGRGLAWAIDEGKDYPRLAWENKPGTPLETRAFPEDQGQGTAVEPYLIRTAQELNAIGDSAAEWDQHYRLECDIDMADLTEPIRIIGRYEAAFTGVFDGNGHSIANFNYPFIENCVGLFGCTEGAVIKGLTLVNPRMEQDATSRFRRVAPLIGQQVDGTVEACGVDGGSVSAGHTVGGLVGVCYGGTVRRCYSTCKVRGWNGSEDIGGLMGRGERCNINNCHAMGEVRGIKSVGGLVGQMVQGNVSHCYAAGIVRPGTDVGGLVGLAKKTVAAGCFWDTQASKQTASAIGTGLSTADMQKAATFITTGWDFADEQQNGIAEIWTLDEGKGYPRFWQEPMIPPEKVWADDFEDGDPKPLWQVPEPSDAASLREVNGRLEVLVPEGGDSAAYVSSGWTLDASQDFRLRVDSHFTASGMGEGWVSIILTPSLDTPIGPHVEFTAGCLDCDPVHASTRADGLGFAIWWTARGSDNNTLYLSYDAAADELYLSYVGYGPANAWRIIAGLLKDRWSGGPLYVVLAGGSDGMEIKAGEAWLDNFAVDTGTVLE